MRGKKRKRKKNTQNRVCETQAQPVCGVKPVQGSAHAFSNVGQSTRKDLHARAWGILANSLRLLLAWLLPVTRLFAAMFPRPWPCSVCYWSNRVNSKTQGQFAFRGLRDRRRKRQVHHDQMPDVSGSGEAVVQKSQQGWRSCSNQWSA